MSDTPGRTPLFIIESLTFAVRPEKFPPVFIRDLTSFCAVDRPPSALIPVLSDDLSIFSAEFLSFDPRLIVPDVLAANAVSSSPALRISSPLSSFPCRSCVAASVTAAGTPSDIPALASAITVFPTALFNPLEVTWSVNLGTVGGLSPAVPITRPVIAPVNLA